MKAPNISFVIPAKNEQASVGRLHVEIVKAMKPLRKSYEIIYIDDGSTDSTFEEVKKLRRKDKKVKLIKLRGNWGKSLALAAGFNKAKGKIIITMDADLQDDPREIPNFLKKLDEGYDLVSGWKINRKDPWHKTIPSKILNFVTRQLTGVKIRDINCGFKAYNHEVVEQISLYGELYRFIPIFAAKQNYKVGEIPIRHRTRKFGKSKYGIERNIKGLIDLLTVIFLTVFNRRPGHFFGILGLVSFGGGFLIGLYISYLRITTGSIQYRHPLLFFGMLLMIIGVQLFTTGLLAELILSLNAKKEKDRSYIFQTLG